jgi:hypothetical protein
MKKYRKKPVVIEAEQYSRKRHIEEGYIPEGVIKNHSIDDNGVPYEGLPYCQTLEGPLRVKDGDWIIKGIQGEYYPIKPDIFEKTYEPLDS